MWPKFVDWNTLRFGVEIEFVEGQPEEVELLSGWAMAMDEKQIDDTGCKSGAELQSPPLAWEDCDQILIMLERLKENGAIANWSCGLHVHVGLEPWGDAIVLPLVEAALKHQSTVQELLQTAEQRLIYCPSLTENMVQQFRNTHSETALKHRGRPQSHRCGINLRSWFDIGTAEIRYANGSLEYTSVVNTVQFCLRFIAAVGAGQELPNTPGELTLAISAPGVGYPPPIPAPQWYWERIWLENLLLPHLQPLVEERFPGGEILEVLPVPQGVFVTGEKESGEPFSLTFELKKLLK